MTTVYIGLGSNVGDRLRWLRDAVQALELSGLRITGRSSVYETEPVGPPQPRFLNAVVEAETDLDPEELLRLVKRLESELGRSPGERWGPREIDLDLLLYGDEEVDLPQLQVPHPRLEERKFVLIGLLEIAPGLHLPDSTPLAEVPQPDQGVRRFAEL